jgi:hypothetical protein
MLAGHYSSALLAKRLVPAAPFWALALAAQLVDVFWAIFVMAGIEHLRLDPALPSNPLDLYDMPWTHSLVGALAWSAAAFVLAQAVWRRTAVSLAIAATVLSHWLLDLLVHRPDLPLWPGSRKLGLAIWNYPAAALALELGLLFGTAWLLSPRVAWRRGLAILVGALAVFQLFVTLVPPILPPAGVAMTGLALFVTVAIAAARIERPASVAA